MPFNSSFLEFAAKNNLPVSYASISYKTFDKDVKASDFVCWWEDISFAEHLLRLFRLKGFTAIITFGDEPLIKTDRKELAHELREKVKEKFIPVISASLKPSFFALRKNASKPTTYLIRRFLECVDLVCIL